MKLVKKVVKRAKKIQRRRKAEAERGNIAHTFASFFDALPCTPSGDSGAQAISRASDGIANLLAVEHVICVGVASGSIGAPCEVVEVPDDPSAVLLAMADREACALRMGGTAPPAFWRALRDALKRCVALDLTFQNPKTGDMSSDAVDVTEMLFADGFEPILRNCADDRQSFRVVFLRRDRIDAAIPQLRQLVARACNPSDHVGPLRNQDIPVFIPCFNNQTYCKAMVAQLLDRQFKDITLIDNCSPSPEMHRFLDEVEDIVKVERLNENLGPKRSVFTPERYDSLPRYFCVTDPDIVFNTFLPDDFIDQLIDLTQEYDVGKAGFALDILHRQFFKDTIVHLLHQKWKIWEWEERFWSNPAGRTPANDPVYRADIDTTFALYDKARWSKGAFFNAVRVGGRFTAGHAPWYAQSDVPQDEREAYTSESAYSYYKM